MEEIITAGQGETVDLMVWRHYGRIWPGLVEAVYAANPGLGALHAIIPIGTRVRMPAYQEPRRARMIRIYD